jgi:hypothetical protein
MKRAVLLALIACGAASLSTQVVHAQFPDAGRWGGQGEKRALCRQSIALAGVEDDMDRRIRGIVRNTRAKDRYTGQDRSSRAYEQALDEALQDAKEPILDQLLDSCATTFTVSELRGINDFYASPPGRAWLQKGRTSIMPAMEQTIAGIQPRISEDVERRYCQRMGC